MTRHPPAFAVCALVFALALSLLPVHSAIAGDAPRAVLIIDGSGSMWGRINKREKIVIVREQLSKKLDLLKGKLDLGIMSYGHRRRRDCRDIEMIRPISPVDPEAHGESINRILPRGKTPIASALQMAAKALSSAPKGQKSTIILVADGNENCRLDPCKMATKLTSKMRGLTINVIGFGLKSKEEPQLECIAKAGKGRFLKATNSQELAQIINRVFTSFDPLASRAKKPQKSKKIIPPGLYLSAGLTQEGPALEDDLNWRIYRAGESSMNGATPLDRKTGTRPFLQLPKAKYHIEVRHGPLLAKKDVTLAAGKAIKLRLSFTVGVITANARLGTSSPLLNDVIFSLYDAASGPVGPSNIIAHKQEKNAIFYLPPGKYTLKARTGETEVRQNFALKAGERKKHTLLLDAGQIDLKASLAKNTPDLRDVQYAIYKRGPEGDSEFVRTLDPTPRLILPAGNYFVLAQKDAAASYNRLAIQAGEQSKASMVLNAGILKLSTNLGDQSPDAEKGQARVAYTIKPLKPTRPKTIKLTADQALEEFDQNLPTRSFRSLFVLPQGDYLVHALYGNSNAEAVRKVRVVAGEVSEEKISLQAGRLKLSLVLAKGNPPLPGVFWSILDKQGKRVASASSITPELTLSTGAYVVVADYLDQSYRRDFTLSNGDNKRIELKLN